MLPVDIRLSAHTNSCSSALARFLHWLGAVLDVADRPIADWDVVMKWLSTRWSLPHAGRRRPVMALVALAIKLDSAGRCCSAETLRLQHELIEVFKFRSSTRRDRRSASKRVHRATRASPGGAFKQDLARRVAAAATWCSRHLRWSGRARTRSTPRRRPLYDEAWTLFRAHRVKPGITGWARSTLRGETDTPERSSAA